MKIKAGKELQKKINSLPTVYKGDANQCIGFSSVLCHIGVNFSNEKYVLYNTGDDWNCPIPEDCSEITVTEYNQLIKKGE
jgi:hypothetical protein